MDHSRAKTRRLICTATCVAAALMLGVVIGAGSKQSLAGAQPPTAHKGLAVKGTGFISESSMKKQLGLSGYRMQLRAITIAPGGQIAKHSHAGRPGLVKVISGTWTEGRPNGERDFSADTKEAILEDADTVHWFWNRGSEPATALVCDIVPATKLIVPPKKKKN